MPTDNAIKTRYKAAIRAVGRDYQSIEPSPRVSFRSRCRALDLRL